jgi:hypothetical protein
MSVATCGAMLNRGTRMSLHSSGQLAKTACTTALMSAGGAPRTLYSFMLIIVVSAGAGPYSLDALILGLMNKHVA